MECASQTFPKKCVDVIKDMEYPSTCTRRLNKKYVLTVDNLTNDREDR